MRCGDIRETISAWVDGEASPEEDARVREHLSSCEPCRVLERQMRAVGAGVLQVRGKTPDRFREAVFARLEAEGVLPPGKKAFPLSWRWATVPLAAAAALGFFLLTSRETVRAPVPQGSVTALVGTSSPAPPQGTAAALTSEDREMIALLDVLEDPAALDADVEAEGIELLAPGATSDPTKPVGVGRNGA